MQALPDFPDRRRRRAGRIESALPEGPAFREAQIVTDRTFIPDLLQRNGDLRQLGVRIYRFELSRPGPD